MPKPKVLPAGVVPTHRALRPIKHLDTVYGAGDLIALDEETAEHLGPTAIEPYTVPMALMTAAQLADAAKDAATREKVIADAAKSAAEAGKIGAAS